MHMMGYIVSVSIKTSREKHFLQPDNCSSKIIFQFFSFIIYKKNILFCISVDKNTVLWIIKHNLWNQIMTRIWNILSFTFWHVHSISLNCAACIFFLWKITLEFLGRLKRVRGRNKIKICELKIVKDKRVITKQFYRVFPNFLSR